MILTPDCDKLNQIAQKAGFSVEKKGKGTKLTPGRMIAMGFAGLIIVGTLLLMLPFATYRGIKLNPLEALFTSTSAVCVTGLVVVNTGTTFTVFGRIVLMLLIQTGGLGIAVIGIAITLMLVR